MVGSIQRAAAVCVMMIGCGDEDPGSSTVDTSGGQPEEMASTGGSASTPTSSADAQASPPPPPVPTENHLLGCFTRADGFDTCEVYCRSRGRTCLERGCNGDGSLLEGAGYTWVSWPATEPMECEDIGYPDEMSFDACTSPIWLQPSKARDDLVRCCCL